MNEQGKKKDLTGGLLIVSKGKSVIIMIGSMAADKKAWHWSSEKSSYLIHCQEAERGRGGAEGGQRRERERREIRLNVKL